MQTEDAKKRHLSITSMTLMLLTVTLAVTIIIITTSDNAFATTSQAAAVNNDCLNPILDSNAIDNLVGVGNCGGTISQQDGSRLGFSTYTSQTANPTIELQRATTTSAQPPLTGESCEDCFAPLTADQVSEFEDRLPRIVNDPGVNTIEEFCEYLANLVGGVEGEARPIITEIGSVLAGLTPPVSESNIESIELCLLGIFG